jgi:hypothetical protein
MNSPRYVNIGKPNGSHFASVGMRVLFPILLCLSCLVLHSLLFSILYGGDGSQGQPSPAMFDPLGNHGQNTPFLPTALFSRLTTVTEPMAIMAQGLFSLPADTETNDTEPVMAKLAKPFLFILSCIAWASRRPIAARQVPIPLYLYYQSLLC